MNIPKAIECYNDMVDYMKCFRDDADKKNKFPITHRTVVKRKESEELSRKVFLKALSD